MLRRFRRLPSPAFVIASIALILAVGGGSFALAISDRKSDKRIAKRVANRQITKRAPGLSVNNASHLGGASPSAYTTASNYTQSSPNTTIHAAFTTIGSPIQVTTDGTKRLIASAAVHATNGVSGTGVYLVCRIAIDGTPGVNDTDYASPAGGFSIVDASVSPLASQLVAAGTHTVTLQCEAVGGGAPSANVVDAALAGWAVSG